MIKLAIFASGSGSNAENIACHFAKNEGVSIDLIVSNKNNAGVLERAKRLNIDTHIISKDDLKHPENLISLLKSRNIDFIILAGFLCLIPKEMVEAYPNRIINIHPALLPNYGGKGMYGDNVHKAVIENKEKESGITIHYVNEKYDEGNIILQAHCHINNDDSFEDLAQKIHKLEYRYFPICIEHLIDLM